MLYLIYMYIPHTIYHALEHRLVYKVGLKFHCDFLKYIAMVLYTNKWVYNTGIMMHSIGILWTCWTTSAEFVCSPRFLLFRTKQLCMHCNWESSPLFYLTTVIDWPYVHVYAWIRVWLGCALIGVALAILHVQLSLFSWACLTTNCLCLQMYIQSIYSFGCALIGIEAVYPTLHLFTWCWTYMCGERFLSCFDTYTYNSGHDSRW